MHTRLVILIVLFLALVAVWLLVREGNPEQAAVEKPRVEAELSDGCDTASIQERLGQIIETSGREASSVLGTFATHTTIPEMVAWTSTEGEQKPFRPCAVEYSYTITIDDPGSDHGEERVREHLLASGWSNDPRFSVSDGSPTTLTLAHADGPMSQTEIFAKQPANAPGTVQFFRTSVLFSYENQRRYRQGEADSPCPCTATVSLSLTEPVPVE